MNVTRQHLRTRALVVMAVAATVLLAACGGGGGSKSSSSKSPADGSAANATTGTTGGGGGKGQCFSTPGTQKARVRFVNLFTNHTYPQSDVDIWQGFSGTDPCGKKLATVAYGTTSDYIDVTASDDSGNWEVGAYVAGATTEDHLIITQTETWKGGEQVTMTVQGQDPTSGNGPSSGADQMFFEKSSATSEGQSFHSVAGKAVLGIAATSVQYVAAKDAAWVAGATGHTSCLLATGDTENTRTNIGGTQLVEYTVDAGSLALSLYKSDPRTCTGSADIGPATIDAAAGSRTLVFVYGTEATALKLLVLPVAA